MTNTWTVGQAAAASSLSAKAVRLYESKGLLPEAPRTAAGYRLYADEDVRTLRFIGQAKTLGLSLNEIREILDIRRGGTEPCDRVVSLLDDRIDEVDRTIAELGRLRRTLTETRDQANERRDRGDGLCGIIEHAAATHPK